MNMKKTNADNKVATSKQAKAAGLRRLPRGSFKARHPNFKPEDTQPSNCKVRVTMYLDADVLEYFKNRASEPNAAPYQTQINSELRTLLERSENGSAYSSLVDDERFINAVAERVHERRVKRA